MENFKEKLLREADHLTFIRSLPCVCCNEPPQSQAAHIRRGSYAGTGQKPSDKDTVPLCHKHHSFQHQVGELTFWYNYGGYEKARVLAKELHKQSGDRECAFLLMLRFKNGKTK